MPYRVVEGPEFQKYLGTCFPNDERLKECVESVKEALSLNPHIGKEVGSDGGIRIIRGQPRQSMPIQFYYYFGNGDGSVVLVGCRQMLM